jgi:hypothetical protein
MGFHVCGDFAGVVALAYWVVRVAALAALILSGSPHMDTGTRCRNAAPNSWLYGSLGGLVIESAAMASDVEKLIQKFASDLQTLIRSDLSDEVNGAVRAALGSGGRAAGKGTKAAPGRRSSNGKRTPEQIEKQAEKILAHVAKNPEQRAEEIAKAVGLTTKELVGPIRKLLGEKKIKASGKARGTNYKAVG